MSLSKENYCKNRDNYFNNILEQSLTVMFSGRNIQRTGDQDYDFEVEKNFYYLTGINQDNVILLLMKNNDVNKAVLFIEKNDPVFMKWYGKKLTKEEATEISGIENVYYLEQFSQFVFGLLNSTRQGNNLYNKMYLSLERRNTKGYSTLALEYAKEVKEKYPELQILNNYITVVNLRMYKSNEEVDLIKKSIETTRYGIEELMKNSKPGIFEYQLESYYDLYIKMNGQKDVSFKTIAAGGVNATVLHYSTNNTLLNDNELVLFDLGCRTDYYISDITRTFPVNGKFTPRQKEVYEKVLNVNKKCIEFLKNGVTWKEYNDYARSLIAKSCIELGLINDEKDVAKYYWHSIGHSIGLDTHDPSLNYLPIKEGMALTVEPGIYIEEEKIGIRIEDDVLITKEGCINLSKEIIKEVNDIEEFMKKNRIL